MKRNKKMPGRREKTEHRREGYKRGKVEIWQPVATSIEELVDTQKTYQTRTHLRGNCTTGVPVGVAKAQKGVGEKTKRTRGIARGGKGSPRAKVEGRNGGISKA